MWTYLQDVGFFFFSSRRRHTIWTGDWSSDVCSSDLARHAPARDRERERDAPERAQRARPEVARGLDLRSEERRVGKEGRSRGSTYHLKKKSMKRRSVNADVRNRCVSRGTRHRPSSRH